MGSKKAGVVAIARRAPPLALFGGPGVGTALAGYGLESWCFSRMIAAGDQSRTSVTWFHASM